MEQALRPSLFACPGPPRRAIARRSPAAPSTPIRTTVGGRWHRRRAPQTAERERVRRGRKMTSAPEGPRGHSHEVHGPRVEVIRRAPRARAHHASLRRPARPAARRARRTPRRRVRWRRARRSVRAAAPGIELPRARRPERTARARIVRCMRPSMRPRATARTWTSGPASAAAAKNSSSLKNPIVNGSAASEAAAIPLDTASTGIGAPARRDAIDATRRGLGHGARGQEQRALRDRVGHHVEGSGTRGGSPPMPYRTTTYPYWEIVE